MSAVSEHTQSADSTKRGLSPVLPALIGLAGVLIGALVTAGVTYLGDRAQRNADKRTAIRLIAHEIRQDANSLSQVATQRRLTGGRPPLTEYWVTQAPTLARYVSAGQWGLVSAFYTDVLNIIPSIPTGKGKGGMVSNATQRYAMTVACEANRAYVALRQTPPIQSIAALNCRD
jgi:hypothetical protein